MMDNLTTSISVSQDIPVTAVPKDKLATPTNKDRFAAAPSGLKIGYGLSYYLPISQSFSSYLQLKPPSIKSIASFKNVFTSPQTMLATGFQLPIITATSPTGHNVSSSFPRPWTSNSAPSCPLPSICCPPDAEATPAKQAVPADKSLAKKGHGLPCPCKSPGPATQTRIFCQDDKLFLGWRPPAPPPAWRL